MNTSTIAGAKPPPSPPPAPTTTSTLSWTAEDTLDLETQIAVFLWRVWPLCIVVLGTFGNIATIVVMNRIKDNHSSQHVILMALAMSDLCLLYVSPFRQWLFHTFGIDLYNLHSALCKFCTWMIYASSTTSSWLLTCVTVQRTMAVTWPHKMRMFCTVRRTWIVVICIVVFACLLHFHFVIGMDIPREKCTFTSAEYEHFGAGIWAWVDLAVFSLFPTICLLVCDFILSFTLFKASSGTASETVQTVSNPNASNLSNTRRKVASRTTVMILALSCTFLLLTLPICIYLIWEYYTFATLTAEVVTTSDIVTSKIVVTSNDVTSENVVTEEPNLWISNSFVFTLTILIWNTNSAINFLLYCFTGTKFRKEFLSWLCCGSQDSGKLSAKFSANERRGK